MGTVHDFGGSYDGEHLEQVAFPLGGIGAGMVCLEGAGALSQVSLRHHLERYHEPLMFSALGVEGHPEIARVLEGPVPRWKIFTKPEAALGSFGTSYGLPRFETATFTASFPFAAVALDDPTMPVSARVTAWSPFTPPDPDDSSLPVAGIEVSLTNTSGTELGCVYSFHAANFLAVGASPRVRRLPSGFVVEDGGHPEMPWTAAALAVEVDAENPALDPAWFRGGWFDWLTMVWRQVQAAGTPDRGEVADPPSPGGSVYVPLRMAPGETRTVCLRLSWYAPASTLREGADPPGASGDDRHRPWYCGRFDGIDSVAEHWASRYGELRERSESFRDAFFDTTLPPEIVEAVAANLAILKTPTVLRQRDGRLWGWEGCMDYEGCGPGSCTHVWNYAQALAHLFPSLERGLRETEFGECQDDRGHQEFRAGLPIRVVAPSFQAAADGQLGGIVKAYRDWRISGDTEWLRGIWQPMVASLDYCIRTWDPRRSGLPEEPQHVTYDIELWGPNAMTGSFYLAALAAVAEMAEALGEDAGEYRGLLEKGRARLESDLFNGEYFVQHLRWRDLDAPLPEDAPSHPLAGTYSPEAMALARLEGPKYQYGQGCLSDGVVGAWLAVVCGLGEQLDPALVAQHLRAVHRHNFRTDLSTHANPQRPGYALGHEAGLLLCSWPHGDKPSLPFIYSDEVWTGIEYQVASHLAHHGLVEECLQIVRAARDRYDGRVRNPFDEYEAGHYYIRAQSSYALLQGLSGIRYDAVEEVLYIEPVLGGDLRCFLATDRGYGIAGVSDGEPFLEVRAGEIEVVDIRYRPAANA